MVVLPPRELVESSKLLLLRHVDSISFLCRMATRCEHIDACTSGNQEYQPRRSALRATFPNAIWDIARFKICDGVWGATYGACWAWIFRRRGAGVLTLSTDKTQGIPSLYGWLQSAALCNSSG